MDEGAILHELGKRIRAQRKHIGLTQEQLALVADFLRRAVEAGHHATDDLATDGLAAD